MLIKRPSPESQPRPPKSVDFLEDDDFEKRELQFDPKTDISIKTEQAMLDTFNKFKPENMAIALSIVYPDRSSHFRLSAYNFDELLKGIRANKNWQKWFFCCEHLADFYFLYPDQRGKIVLDEEDFQKIMASLELEKNEYNIYNYLQFLFYLSIIFPNRRGEFGMEDCLFDDAKKYLERIKEKNDLFAYAPTAMYLSVLFPHRKDELELSPEFFDKMKSYFSQCPTVPNNYQECSEYAKFLVILSAKRAYIDSNGRLIIEKSPSLKVKKRKPLPQISKVRA